MKNAKVIFSLVAFALFFAAHAEPSLSIEDIKARCKNSAEEAAVAIAYLKYAPRQRPSYLDLSIS